MNRRRNWEERKEEQERSRSENKRPPSQPWKRNKISID